MLKPPKEKIIRIWARLSLFSIEAIISLLFLCASIGFVFIVYHIFKLHNTNPDNEVFEYMKPYVNDRNNHLISGITFLGSHYFLIPANLLLIFYFLFVRKHQWYSIKVSAIAMSSLALMLALKQLFSRERPLKPLLAEAQGFSFPSGHALMSITFYGLLIYIIWQTVKNKYLRMGLIIALILIILLIGYSRIYLRVHYASDVIAGFCMGFLWLVFSVRVIDRFEKVNRQKVKLKNRRVLP